MTGILAALTAITGLAVTGGIVIRQDLRSREIERWAIHAHAGFIVVAWVLFTEGRQEDWYGSMAGFFLALLLSGAARWWSRERRGVEGFGLADVIILGAYGWALGISFLGHFLLLAVIITLALMQAGLSGNQSQDQQEIAFCPGLVLSGPIIFVYSMT